MANTTIVAQPPEDFQVEDIEILRRLPNSANWSEMGAKKTSTGLWYIQKIAEDEGIKNPKVLIVTTRSGKGTFFQLAPILLPGWQLYNADLRGVSTFMNGVQIKLPIEALGDNFNMPVIVVSHYHVFLKANRGMPQVHADGPDKGYPLTDANGRVIFKPLTQADYLTEIDWDFEWLDEAHRIKERKNKWVKNLKKVRAKHRHVSTGTGFINRPQEIWSLLHFLDRKKFGNYWRFVGDFCIEEVSDSGFRKVIGIKPEKKAEFRELVRSYGPRRELTEVMPHLKEPIKVRREVELSPIQRKMYNEIMHELETLDKNGTPFQTPTILSALQRMRQICVATPEVVNDYFDSRLQKRVIEIRLIEPSSKLDALMDVIEELQWDDDSRQQLVVFSNFTDPLKLLGARLDEASIPYIHLEAKDNDATRYDKWSVQWPKKEHQIFMSTVSLGGESINLTSAQHICFLDRSWSPKDTAQAIGRVRRPGQEGQPVVINIEAEDTTDQYVEGVNIRKQGWFNQIFSNVEPEEYEEVVNPDEIEEW